MAVKERRTKILFALFLLTDVKFDPVSLDEKIQTVFDIYFNQKTRGTLSGLINEGLIEKGPVTSAKPVSQPIENLEPPSSDELPPTTQAEVDSTTESSSPEDDNSYRLTLEGFHELCLDFPFFRFM